jgi:hypothetical protein
MSEAEQERKRITDIIRNRIDVINNTIESCAKNNIRAPLTIFDLANELRMVLREIEKDQST